MKVKIFLQDQCPNCPPAKELGKQLESDGIVVEYYDTKSPDGLGEAVYHGIMAAPSIVIVDGGKGEIASWEGKSPTLEEIKTLLEETQ